MSSIDEVVTIVDEDNRIVGVAPRREMRSKRLPHRSTYILVFNSQGELYVHQRTMTKDLFPGYYDAAVGGVVLAGETYEQGARRELAEEVGIRDVPLTWLFAFYFVDEHTRVWGGAFSCVYDGEIVPQAEEIASGTFLSLATVQRLAQTKPFTPDSLYVLSRYLTASITPPPTSRHS